MANPQTENGYTKIANELLDAIIKVKLSDAEYRIFLCILRFSYGFNQKEAKLSLSRIRNLTGLPERTVSRAVSKLKKKNMIFQTTDYVCSVWKINKYWDSWNNEKESTHAKNDTRQECQEEYAKSGGLPLSKMSDIKESKEIVKKSAHENQAQLGIDLPPEEKQPEPPKKPKKKKPPKVQKMTEEDWKEFWEAYPRNDKKAIAKDKFLKLNRDLLPTILSSIKSQRKSLKWDIEPQYIPMPSTWIHQRRWEDDEKKEVDFKQIEDSVLWKMIQKDLDLDSRLQDEDYDRWLELCIKYN